MSSETVTLQQTGGSVNSISTVQSASNVSTFYSLTGGNYGGPADYKPNALETYLFVHEDTKKCGYSLVAISGSSVGDVTYKLPGNVTKTAVQDATGTYKYDSKTGKTTIKLTGTGGTKGFAASMTTGCFTLEVPGSLSSQVPSRVSRRRLSSRVRIPKSASVPLLPVVVIQVAAATRKEAKSVNDAPDSSTSFVGSVSCFVGVCKKSALVFRGKNVLARTHKATN